MKRKQKTRYWIDDPSISWTPGQVRKLPKQKRIDVASAWFLQRFQDPAIETPYETREGGYQYIWGGPYDAADEIGSEFASVLSDAEIETAVEEVQSDGIYDWAPIRTDELGEPDEDEHSDIEDAKEEKLRHEILQRLSELAEAIPDEKTDPPSGPGIGHNNPPEPISASTELHFRELRVNVQQLIVTFSASIPASAIAEKQAGLFRRTIDRIVELYNKTEEGAIASGTFSTAAHVDSMISLLPVVIHKAELAWKAINDWLLLIPLF
jgi:hypothetical protein